MVARMAKKRYKFTLIEYLHDYFFVFYHVSEKNSKKLFFLLFSFLPIFKTKRVKIGPFQKVKSQARICLNGTTSRNDLFGKKVLF